MANQLNYKYTNLTKYRPVHATKFRHFKDIYVSLNYNKFETSNKIQPIANEIALATGNKFDMVKKFIEQLRLNRIIMPTISTIEEVISKAILQTDDIIYTKIYSQIQNKEKLNDLLIAESNGISCFSRIKSASVNISSSGVKELLKLIKEINEYGEVIDLSFLSESKVRYFNSQIQRSHKARVERFKDEHKKYSYLSMFLYFKRKEFMDMIIEVTSSHAHAILKRSKKKTQEYNVKNQAKYKFDSEKLKVVVKNIIENSNFNDFKEYQNSLSDLKKQLDSQETDLEEIDFLLKSYKSIDYINDLLEVIEFDSNTKPELIIFLKEFKNQRNKKKNKIDISFFDNKWQKNIKKYEYSKKMIDMTVIYTLRDSIRSGDIFVRDSKKYN